LSCGAPSLLHPANSLAERLLPWYSHYGRHHLPWQQQRNAYNVWLSEIMLQQTQVATVIPYFQRFIQAFPTLTALAAGSEDQVLHLWTGLGYYSRARNLHRTARLVTRDFSGQLPKQAELLQQLPGIGRSTAGAILSMAYQIPSPILDGNVKRVLSRIHAISGWPGLSAVEKLLWQLTTHYTPKHSIVDYTQAIMDLGATVCTRSRPQCERCPLQTLCQAYQQGNPSAYPHSKPRKQLPIRASYFLLMQDFQGRVLLEKRPPLGIWGSLWCFPSCSMDKSIIDVCEHHYAETLLTLRALPHFRHTFSHFHLDIHPLLITVKPRRKPRLPALALRWQHPTQTIDVGLAAPVLKLLKSLQKENTHGTQC
jgi:A/G-specific adenine glycosylase